jgi:hypothetical protein
MTVRSSIAAFSTGTSVDSGCSEITNPPGCCDRCRGNPSKSPAIASTRRSNGDSGSNPWSRKVIGHRHVAVPAIHRLRDLVDLVRRQTEARAHVAHGTAPAITDHHRRQRRAPTP